LSSARGIQRPRIRRRAAESRRCRGNSLAELRVNLKRAANAIEQKWDGVEEFELNGQNKPFVKHLLSRITAYVDKLVGKDTTYINYKNPSGKPSEIEHIWSDKFEEHRDEFEQENEFKKWRNSIGALLLLPNGTNQSFNSDKYPDKLKHYYRENTYAQTLNKLFYDNNPNFLNNPQAQVLSFSPHDEFKKNDLLERQALVQRICEQIWSLDSFDE
jgi:hypothetical protein